MFAYRTDTGNQNGAFRVYFDFVSPEGEKEKEKKTAIVRATPGTGPAWHSSIFEKNKNAFPVVFLIVGSFCLSNIAQSFGRFFFVFGTLRLRRRHAPPGFCTQRVGSCGVVIYRRTVDHDHGIKHTCKTNNSERKKQKQKKK